MGFGVARRCRRRDEFVVALVTASFLFGARRQLLGRRRRRRRRRVPVVVVGVVGVVVSVVVTNQLPPHLIRIVVAIGPGLPEWLGPVLNGRRRRNSSSSGGRLTDGGAIRKKRRNSVVLAGHWPPTGHTTHHYTIAHCKDHCEDRPGNAARNSSAPAQHVLGGTHGVVLLFVLALKSPDVGCCHSILATTGFGGQ